MAALRRMELGQIVDYCTEWNRIHEPEDSEKGGKKKEKVKKRKATQADWDAFFG